MALRNESPVPYRPHRSEFDDRAINVTCHLLLGAVSLERHVALVPKQLSALFDVARRSGSTGRLWGPVAARAIGRES